MIGQHLFPIQQAIPIAVGVHGIGVIGRFQIVGQAIPIQIVIQPVKHAIVVHIAQQSKIRLIQILVAEIHLIAVRQINVGASHGTVKFSGPFRINITTGIQVGAGIRVGTQFKSLPGVDHQFGRIPFVTAGHVELGAVTRDTGRVDKQAHRAFTLDFDLGVGCHRQLFNPVIARCQHHGAAGPQIQFANPVFAGLRKGDGGEQQRRHLIELPLAVITQSGTAGDVGG